MCYVKLLRTRPIHDTAPSILLPSSISSAKLYIEVGRYIYGGEQVMALYRDQLRSSDVLTAAQVARKRHGEKVRVAGLVVHQAPPTANGHHFLTLEDGTGLVDIIVRPKVYSAHRAVLNSAPILVVEGVVRKGDGRMSVLAWRVEEINGSAA